MHITVPKNNNYSS